MKINKPRGFTLIELLVAVAIVGILAAIAIPSYQESVKKSRMADAKGALLGLANAMERHFTEVNSYCDAASNSGTTVTDCGDASVKDKGAPAPSIFSTVSPVDGNDGPYYNLTIQDVTPNTFTLRATPVNSQANDKCGKLVLQNNGVKDIVDEHTGVDIEDCW